MEVDEEVEGMQSTIVFLQKQLKETREQVASLERQNHDLQMSLDTLNVLSERDINRTTLENNFECKMEVEPIQHPADTFTNDESPGNSSHPETASKVNVVTKSPATNNPEIVQNGSHDSKTDGEPRTENVNDVPLQGEEPMDSSAVEETSTSSTHVRENDVETVNRTPNGKEKSSEFRTKKANHNVDSETEVQVAQTLAAWANCENESDVPIKSKSSKVTDKEDAIL